MTSIDQPVAAALAYRTMRVRRVQALTPGMLRVTFTGDDLRDLPGAPPDGYIKLFFPLPGQQRPQLPPPFSADNADATSWYRGYLAMSDDTRPPMRTYTVRAHRPEAAELDVDFVRHTDSGPAARWADQASPGEEVAFLGPHGLHAVPEGTSWQLLVGDESALPAIAAILAEVPDGAHASAYIEVADVAEEQDLACPGSVDVRWVHRGSAAHGTKLLEAVRAAEFPVGVPYAWLGGEAETVKLTRRHLVRDRDVPKRVITFTGYWRHGRTEDDEGRENLRRIDAGEPVPAEPE